MGHYKEITCSSACHKVKGGFPYTWDLNVYRGCEHGCKYCFAMYTHKYLESEAYFDEIYIKTNIVDRLEEQISRPSWKKEVINLGGVTDNYQPLEARYKFMPDILRLLIKYRNPCIISTKSDLILRDFDLIAELAEVAFVNVAATITCMDERVRRMVEPNGAESMKRFAMLKEFSRTRATRGVHFMPIIPYITDRRSNVDALYAQAKDNGVTYVLPGLLNLRGRTRTVFFEFIRESLPKLYEPLQTLYGKNGELKEYRNRMYRMLHEVRNRYGMTDDYMSSMSRHLNPPGDAQMTLF